MTPVEISKLHGLEVQISLTRPFRFRVAIAVALIRVACWVLGGKLEVEHEPD